MNTFSVDTLRVDIFKELINLDQEKLSEVYKYVKELASKGNSETLILKEMLDASADYAVKAHKRGEFHSTEEVMERLGKEMGCNLDISG